MPSLNKVMLIGNVTRDPDLRYTPAKASAVVDLGIALNRRYRLESGEEREEVTFVDVTFFGKQAETLHKYIKKGRQIYVEGRLRLDSWDDKNTGQKVYKMRVVGEEFQFLGTRQENEGSGGSSGGGGGGGGEYPGPPQRTNYPPRSSAPASQPAQRPQQQQAQEPDMGELDGDDIPF